MATRVVEGKKPYTGGKAISIDENKVISLNLRDENNLIIYDEGDDEIYVDLQLPDGIEPTDAFPVGVTTGRAVVADGWDKAGTIISAKTTSGDEIKILYADEGTLWIDNGTGTFKQIYFKADVDAIAQAIWDYIHANVNTKTFYLASDQDLTTAQAIYDWWEAGNNPIIIYNNQSYSLYREVQGVIEFFENTPHAMTIWNDRTALVHHNIGIYEINDQIHLDITLNYSSLGDACFLSTEVNYETPYTPQYAGSPATKAYVDSHSGDVLVSDQANNIFTPGMKIWGGTESDYQSLTPDSNTAYLLLAGGPTPGGWQPGVDTLVYYDFEHTSGTDEVNQANVSNYDGTYQSTPTIGTLASGKKYFDTEGNNSLNTNNTLSTLTYNNSTVNMWINVQTRDKPVAGQIWWQNGTATIFCETYSSNMQVCLGEIGACQSAFSAPSTNTRFNLVMVNDGTTITYYVNNVVNGTSTSTSATGNYYFHAGGAASPSNEQTLDSSHTGDSRFGSIIIENKARTAQEVSDYFDQTKANYGIS